MKIQESRSQKSQKPTFFNQRWLKLPTRLAKRKKETNKTMTKTVRNNSLKKALFQLQKLMT